MDHRDDSLLGRLPIQEAKQIYLREPCSRTFEEDLSNHLNYGIVVSLPHVFAMARPVIGDPAFHRQIVDSAFQFDPKEVDCWHVFALAGDMQAAATYLPYRLPKLSWERHNALRICCIKRILNNLEKSYAYRLPFTLPSA